MEGIIPFVLQVLTGVKVEKDAFDHYCVLFCIKLLKITQMHSCSGVYFYGPRFNEEVNNSYTFLTTVGFNECFFLQPLRLKCTIFHKDMYMLFVNNKKTTLCFSYCIFLNAVFGECLLSMKHGVYPNFNCTQLFTKNIQAALST